MWSTRSQKQASTDLESRRKRYPGHKRNPETIREGGREDRKFPYQSAEMTEPCTLLGRGRDAMMWNKCARAWDPNRHSPQEGNMEAMRHDTVERVTFCRWENKFSKLDTHPHPQRKDNQR